MEWNHYLSYFFGGAFLANSIPHMVSGIMGRAFQTPFAHPRGQGLSTSTTNVVWGFFNITIGYLLVLHVGNFDIHNCVEVGTLGVGAFTISFILAKRFGHFHGGNLIKASD